MTKKIICGFAFVSLFVVACAAPSGTEEEGAATTSEALEVKPTPGAGESCHADGAGVTNGTMTSSGWCCGVAICDEPSTCGAELGHLVPSCAACDWYKCDPGASRTGINPRPEVLKTAGNVATMVSDGTGASTPYRPTHPHVTGIGSRLNP